VLLPHALCVYVMGAVSGPGSRELMSLDWSGGALIFTWVDLLLYRAGNPLAKRVMMIRSAAHTPLPSCGPVHVLVNIHHTPAFSKDAQAIGLTHSSEQTSTVGVLATQPSLPRKEAEVRHRTARPCSLGTACNYLPSCLATCRGYS